MDESMKKVLNPFVMQVNKAAFTDASRRTCEGFLGRFLQGVLSIFDFGYSTRKFPERSLRDPKLDATHLEADWMMVGSHINESMKSHLKQIKTKELNDDLARKIELWGIAEEFRRREIEQRSAERQLGPERCEINRRPPSRIYAKTGV
jgi:hypothetical protein